MVQCGSFSKGHQHLCWQLQLFVRPFIIFTLCVREIMLQRTSIYKYRNMFIYVCWGGLQHYRFMKVKYLLVTRLQSIIRITMMWNSPKSRKHHTAPRATNEIILKISVNLQWPRYKIPQCTTLVHYSWAIFYFCGLFNIVKLQFQHGYILRPLQIVRWNIIHPFLNRKGVNNFIPCFIRHEITYQCCD